jgi:hypothetical protein
MSVFHGMKIQRKTPQQTPVPTPTSTATPVPTPVPDESWREKGFSGEISFELLDTLPEECKGHEDEPEKCVSLWLYNYREEIFKRAKTADINPLAIVGVFGYESLKHVERKSIHQAVLLGKKYSKKVHEYGPAKFHVTEGEEFSPLYKQVVETGKYLDESDVVGLEEPIEEHVEQMQKPKIAIEFVAAAMGDFADITDEYAKFGHHIRPVRDLPPDQQALVLAWAYNTKSLTGEKGWKEHLQGRYQKFLGESAEASKKGKWGAEEKKREHKFREEWDVSQEKISIWMNDHMDFIKKALVQKPAFKPKPVVKKKSRLKKDQRGKTP